MEHSKFDKYRMVVFTLVYVILVLLVFTQSDIIGIGMIIAFFFPSVRYFVWNFDLWTRSFIVNGINYFRYKEYNYPHDIGVIDAYVASSNKVFGCCKTLLAVKRTKELYQRFNGAETYDYKCLDPQWITWKVNIISNVDIKGIPTIPLKSLHQLVELSEKDCHDTFTIVLIDECNAVFNSRNFKSNLNEEQIKSIVTCRHNNMCMFLVGQRFKYLDALVRSMCDCVIECSHIPLLNTTVRNVYSAYDMETVDNPAMIKRLKRTWQYIFQSDYKSYDTKALVEGISRDDSLTSEEVLAKRGNVLTGAENARQLSAKGKKLLRRK